MNLNKEIRGVSCKGERKTFSSISIYIIQCY